jgi:hypothetical protein
MPRIRTGWCECGLFFYTSLFLPPPPTRGVARNWQLPIPSKNCSAMFRRNTLTILSYARRVLEDFRRAGTSPHTMEALL